jgi:DNA polymerase-3 subunit alpha
MTALALTDHGNMHGALEFYRACKGKDINPIIGYEAYIAPGSRKVKGDGKRNSSYHLTLLCQNKTGFDNLIKMASSAALEGFYFKPRIDKELLEAHSEGIICLSGCVSSEFSKAVLAGGNGAEDHIEKAIEVAQWFRNLFGERYFVEVMNNGLEIQRQQLQGAVEVANRVGIPVVATSDCHYVDREDATAQDVMLCINTGRFRTDQNRMSMEGDEFYLRPPEEMYRNFKGMEDAVSRTQEIADSVDIQLKLGERYFPVYDLPESVTPEGKLRELCENGLKDRYKNTPDMLTPEGELSEVVQARLDRELGVINKLGFANYFLIVWDFVEQARIRDIPTTARGSGVGAIVCYALYLSHVCPIKYDLLFERFLDENRLEAPDIDIDFCKERRGDIIQYVKEKYGEESVAQIGTFGTMKAKAAIKDVGRALGIPLARVNEITKMIPDVLGITIEKALETSDELRSVYEGDPEITELIDFAKKLEGLARNIGTHAAAVVIGEGPLDNYVPLGKVAGKDDVITQWSMNDVEDAGLLKMDFLGLRNLTILSNVVNIIEQTRGERIDIHSFPLDDKPTYALLQRGETKGVFQMESGGIRDLLQRMKPDHFLDIIATAALYRPGPLEGGMVDQYIDVKHGRKEPEYKLDLLKEILEETNGVMVYQEQVMRILNRVGMIPLASAYTCIKAISKKKEKLIAQNYEGYMKGAVEQGLSKKDAQELWDMILKFAGYGFNKSHSTAYALIAYQTAYLKCHYPMEFMAALLTGDIPGRNFVAKDSLVEHMEDCDRMGIDVKVPTVNTSDVHFAVDENNDIHFAMSAIKGCGGSASQAIVDERRANGPFKDIFDFCERVETSKCSRSSMESLIKAGAMDCFGGHRAQLMAALDRAIQAGSSLQADKKSGQMNLFGAPEPAKAEESAASDLPDVPEWEEREKLVYEKEVLGYYLTSHPLAEYADRLEQFCSHKSSELEGCKHRDKVSMGGMIASLRLAHTKNQKSPSDPTKYAMFDLEDVDGAIRTIAWPSTFANVGEFVKPDAVVVVQGKLDYRGDEPNLIVDKLIPIDELGSTMTTGLKISIDQAKHGHEGLKTAYEIIRGYPGPRQLKVELVLENKMRVQLDSQKTIAVSEEVCGRLRELLGTSGVEMLVDQKSLSAKAGPEKGWGRKRD